MIPKFRVFVKSGTKQMYGGVYEEDAMVPVGVLDITGEEVTVWGCGRENCEMCDDYFRMKDITLMQSTGLEDKNGVEIYEGDIVHVLDRLNETPFEAEGHIVYEQDDCAFEIALGLHRYSLHKTKFVEYEIIGNIYENPELLKEVPHGKLE